MTTERRLTWKQETQSQRRQRRHDAKVKRQVRRLRQRTPKEDAHEQK